VATEISSILDLYHQGDYKKTLEIIEEMPADDKLTILKARVYNKLERYQKAIEILQNFFNDENNKYGKYQKYLSEVLMAQNYVDLGKYQLALEHLDRTQIIADGYFDIETAAPDEIEFRIRWFFVNARLNRLRGDNVTASNSITVAFSIIENNTMDHLPLLKSNVYNEAGNIYEKLGDYSNSLKYYQKALEIRESVGNQLEVALSLNNLGVVSINKGELDQSIKYFLASLEIYKKMKVKSSIARAYNNLGYVYDIKNDLDQAQQYLEMSLALNTQIGNKFLIMNNLNNLAKVFLKKGEIEEAKQILNKSLNMNSEEKNVLVDSEARMIYIFLAFDMNDQELALEHFRYLEEIESTNRQISFRKKFTKAIMLRFSNRIISQAQAQKLFYEIIEEEEVPHDFKTMSLVHLSELLLNELKVSEEIQDVLSDLIEVSKLLTLIAEKQSNYSLVIQSLFLQSKLSLLHNDLETARNYLIEASEMAKEKDLMGLYEKAKKQMEELSEEVTKWTHLLKDNVKIIDKLQHGDVLGYLKDMVKQFEHWY
jgi:tetratricopeptide (TPR) repeat protein